MLNKSNDIYKSIFVKKRILGKRKYLISLGKFKAREFSNLYTWPLFGQFAYFSVVFKLLLGNVIIIFYYCIVW